MSKTGVMLLSSSRSPLTQLPRPPLSRKGEAGRPVWSCLRMFFRPTLLKTVEVEGQRIEPTTKRLLRSKLKLRMELANRVEQLT